MFWGLKINFFSNLFARFWCLFGVFALLACDVTKVEPTLVADTYQAKIERKADALVINIASENADRAQLVAEFGSGKEEYFAVVPVSDLSCRFDSAYSFQQQQQIVGRLPKGSLLVRLTDNVISISLKESADIEIKVLGHHCTASSILGLSALHLLLREVGAIRQETSPNSFKDRNQNESHCDQLNSTVVTDTISHQVAPTNDEVNIGDFGCPWAVRSRYGNIGTRLNNIVATTVSAPRSCTSVSSYTRSDGTPVSGHIRC